MWGILNALVGIGIAGQASIDKVAGPVGEALIMTALGLFVAVPAVLGYNWLLGRNKVLQDALRNFASDLHAYLVGGVQVESGAGADGAVRPRPRPRRRRSAEDRAAGRRAGAAHRPGVPARVLSVRSS